MGEVSAAANILYNLTNIFSEVPHEAPGRGHHPVPHPGAQLRPPRPAAAGPAQPLVLTAAI